MKDVEGRVAVVTGAASGIGLATAHAFADAGMKVVLADIEEGPLATAVEALEAKGAEVLAVPTNVASEGAVNRLADAAFDGFGNVHVLFNNAGVAATAATLIAAAGRVRCPIGTGPSASTSWACCMACGRSFPGCSTTARRATSSTRRRSPGY